jgi:hypothetical protein
MILLVVTATLLPILLTVSNERIAIQQEKNAFDYLNKAITSWIYEDKTFWETDIKEYETDYKLTFTFNEDHHELSACIAWIAANDRYYERCESAKR